MATKYTGDEIQVLEGLEPVRKNPGMYIGSTGRDGYHHLLWEVVDNSIDEVISKHATKVEVTLHKNGKSATVEDNGRGITVIKTTDDDVVIGFIAGVKSDQHVVETEKSGKDFSQKADPKEVSARGGKGRQVVKKTTLVAPPKPVTIQPLANAEGGQGVN